MIFTILFSLDTKLKTLSIKPIKHVAYTVSAREGEIKDLHAGSLMPVP